MSGVVVADSLTKRYDGTTALDSVSLSIGSGEVYALVGPNGAGKTTLVQTLTGTVTPTAGTVELFGDPPRIAEKSRLGLLPQSFTPPERLTPRELITYYAGLYEDTRQVTDVLEAVGMQSAADTRFTDLSGGQQRRTCVGLTLVNDPDLLFLDEPTTGIDPAGRQSMWDLLSTLSERGTTVVLTTHYMEEAERLADRVALLSDGSLVTTGSPTDLVEHADVGTQLHVRTAAPENARQTLAYPTEPTSSGIRIEDVSPAELADIVRTLDEHGIPYSGLSWTEPDLEDVYLELTDSTGGPSQRPDGDTVLEGAR